LGKTGYIYTQQHFSTYIK